jgi:hypothetical protein
MILQSKPCKALAVSYRCINVFLLLFFLSFLFCFCFVISKHVNLHQQGIVKVALFAKTNLNSALLTKLCADVYRIDAYSYGYPEAHYLHHHSVARLFDCTCSFSVVFIAIQIVVMRDWQEFKRKKQQNKTRPLCRLRN